METSLIQSVPWNANKLFDIDIACSLERSIERDPISLVLRRYRQLPGGKPRIVTRSLARVTGESPPLRCYPPLDDAVRERFEARTLS